MLEEIRPVTRSETQLWPKIAALPPWDDSAPMYYTCKVFSFAHKLHQRCMHGRNTPANLEPPERLRLGLGLGLGLGCPGRHARRFVPTCAVAAVHVVNVEVYCSGMVSRFLPQNVLSLISTIKVDVPYTAAVFIWCCRCTLRATAGISAMRRTHSDPRPLDLALPYAVQYHPDSVPPAY